MKNVNEYPTQLSLNFDYAPAERVVADMRNVTVVSSTDVPHLRLVWQAALGSTPITSHSPNSPEITRILKEQGARLGW